MVGLLAAAAADPPDFRKAPGNFYLCLSGDSPDRCRAYCIFKHTETAAQGETGYACAHLQDRGAKLEASSFGGVIGISLINLALFSDRNQSKSDMSTVAETERMEVEESGKNYGDSLEDSTQYNETDISKNAVKLQNDLTKLKMEIVQAKAKMAASQRDVEGEEGDLYGAGVHGDSEELNKLTQERTQTFLNFTSLQVAIKAAQANQALTKALNLEKEGNISLEKEEEEYVRELLEEQKELSEQIFKNQEAGVEQELAVIKSRAELAKLHCRYQELVGEVVGARREKGEENWDKETTRLQEQLKNGDYKVNQLRFMIQKFMISHKKLGLQFDDEKNAQFKALFLRCGKTPEELRQQILSPDEGQMGDMAPAAAADLEH